MAYRIVPQEPMAENIKRIAREQIQKALAETRQYQDDPDETIHQIRKRCKKIRALLRLVRYELDAQDTYRFENQWFRDAARQFSSIRDVKAVIETYDELMDVYEGQIDREGCASIRHLLVQEQEQFSTAENDIEVMMKAFETAMNEALGRIDDWSIGHNGFETLAEGFLTTYRRGRKAMKIAYEETTDESFHEWRKRAKYYYHHIRLLRNSWKPVLKSLVGELKTLSDYLGDDHNLAILYQRILKDPDRYGSAAEQEDFLELIHRRRAELRSLAWTLGMRVYADKPGAHRRRFSRYWQAWRTETQEPVYT